MTGPMVVDTVTPLLGLYPQLAHARQPELVTPTGEPPDRAKIVTDGRWRRRLVDDVGGYCGPVVMTGDRMPSMSSAALVAAYIDPKTIPRDGDMVLADYSAGMAELIDVGSKNPTWWKQYRGTTLGTAVMKQYRVVDGHRLLATDYGSHPYGESRVLGVLRHYFEPNADEIRDIALELLRHKFPTGEPIRKITITR